MAEIDTNAFNDSTESGPVAPGTRVPNVEEIKASAKLLESIEGQVRANKGVLVGYARDRRMAANRVGEFEVAVPIAQSYVDVLRSFLYARDPEVVVDPSKATEPPPETAVMAKARKQVTAEAQQHQAEGDQASEATGDPGQVQPMDPQAIEEAVKKMAFEIMQPYLEHREDAEALSETLEIVVQELWKRANLKAQAKLQVNSALTIGIGWLKCVWLERSERDSVVDKQINDMHTAIANLHATRQELSDDTLADRDAKIAEHKQQLAGLESSVQKVVERGLVIDFLAGEDVILGPCRGMWDYLNAPWICSKHYFTVGESRSRWPNLGDRLKKATTYYAKLAPDPADQGTDVISANISPQEAEGFSQQQLGNGEHESSNPDDRYVCVYEVYDRSDGTIKTMIDGLKGYVEKPKPPKFQTTRFFPYFLLAIGLIDGERHPRSLISRSTKLFNEYNAVRSNLRVHRRRTLPKTVFDKTNISEADAAKIEGGDIQEMIGVKPTRPGQPVSDMIEPIRYAPIDPALYDTGPIRADLELVWGIQEALSSSIHTAKTATEAEIQNQGTESRTGYMREAIDDQFSDLAQYTAEIAVSALSEDDVREMAGDWALWPSANEDGGSFGIDKIAGLVDVQIRAGSSGKPNTSAKMQVWTQLIPLLQEAIKEVGQLRNSSPDEIADAIEEVVRESFKRTGERADTSRFLPQAADPGTPKPQSEPPPVSEVSMAGPQLVALTAVLTNIRAGVLSPDSAEPLIVSAFPTLPEKIIKAMVSGAAVNVESVPPQGEEPSVQPVAEQVA